MFRGGCGLTEVQCVRTDGEITLSRGSRARQTIPGRIPAVFTEKTMSQTSYAEPQRASLCHGHDIIRSRAGHEREQDSRLTTNPEISSCNDQPQRILGWSEPPPPRPSVQNPIDSPFFSTPAGVTRGARPSGKKASARAAADIQITNPHTNLTFE